MLDFVLILHIVIAIAIIVLVLLQHGKGADMGASFGSGSSTTVFGSRGAMPFLLKLTGLLAALFFVTSLSLGHLSAIKAAQGNKLSLPKSLNPVSEKNKDKAKEVFDHKKNDDNLINKIQKQSS